MQLESSTETLIWDLDGTLLDSFGLYQEILADVLPSLGYAVPVSNILMNNFHGSLEDSIGNAISVSDTAVVEAIVEAFLAKQNAHYESVDHHLFADAVQLVQKAHLKGIKQIIVSNRNHEGRQNASPRNIVARSVLAGQIDTVICGDDSEYRKPDPRVLASLHEPIDSDRTIVIGDQFIDAQFAKNLGARALLVDRNGTIPHLNMLGNDYGSWVTQVQTLSAVS